MSRKKRTFIEYVSYRDSLNERTWSDEEEYGQEELNPAHNSDEAIEILRKHARTPFEKGLVGAYDRRGLTDKQWAWVFKIAHNKKLDVLNPERDFAFA